MKPDNSQWGAEHGGTASAMRSPDAVIPGDAPPTLSDVAEKLTGIVRGLETAIAVEDLDTVEDLTADLLIFAWALKDRHAE